MIVGLIIAAVVLAAAAFCLLSDWVELQKRRARDAHKGQRGFEVKLDAGQAPAMKEKANDHG